MTPTVIIQRATEVGVSIIVDGEKLRVRGPRDAIAEITPLVKMNKPAILAALTTPIQPDLERLIVRAGEYWEYSTEDYDLIRAAARCDPDGLRLALLTDPLAPYMSGGPSAP